jgi:DNA-binding response OmpR family regulator
VPRILVMEDEQSILMGLEDDLRLEGYEVSGVSDGVEGLASASQGGYNLIILDIMLPKMDGFEVCKRLRHSGITTPILMLTAKSQDVDKVLGLELGADDYVTKPFSPRELLARVKALLRRATPAAPAEARFSFGDVHVDFRTYAVTKGGAHVPLTLREFELLRHLIEHRDEVTNRASILEEVWGDDWDVFPRTIDTHIVHLRKKLEDDPANPKHILNVRGIGYRFVADPS